ncbi:DDE-type integrase/transposase/recombinase [Serratia marcescens]|uniref:DDE-type integrase/transposase/recombinase n=1 Tax=Serratia marcescens TaxID=615 RepID=UPI003FA73D07|nr:DDE-type integrase/transposase/recombinase [Serratia marcescens]
MPGDKKRWYWHHSNDLRSWYLDAPYVKVSGKWFYLYRATDNREHTVDFYLSLRP